MEISRLLRRLAASGLIATSLCAGSGTAADAQSTVGQTPANPGVSVVAPPPPGYNPLTGTPPANTQFALPPAPNPQTTPEAYTAWQRAVAAAQNRETSVLTPTNIFNGPIQEKQSASPQSTADSGRRAPAHQLRCAPLGAGRSAPALMGPFVCLTSLANVCAIKP